MKNIRRQSGTEFRKAITGSGLFSFGSYKFSTLFFLRFFLLLLRVFHSDTDSRTDPFVLSARDTMNLSGRNSS